MREERHLKRRALEENQAGAARNPDNDSKKNQEKLAEKERKGKTKMLKVGVARTNVRSRKHRPEAGQENKTRNGLPESPLGRRNVDHKRRAGPSRGWCKGDLPEEGENSPKNA